MFPLNRRSQQQTCCNCTALCGDLEGWIGPIETHGVVSQPQGAPSQPYGAPESDGDPQIASQPHRFRQTLAPPSHPHCGYLSPTASPGCRQPRTGSPWQSRSGCPNIPSSTASLAPSSPAHSKGFLSRYPTATYGETPGQALTLDRNHRVWRTAETQRLGGPRGPHGSRKGKWCNK